MVKCDCGQEFADYRINWKLSCRMRLRGTMKEAVPNPDLDTFYRKWLGQPLLDESPDCFMDKTKI